ncbi:hypothetical protein [Pelobacter seleniigenes]|uniref:hypothetical protein n=1 Tax=Pelobacter seleniigenes TaxID=407188 RepID=UPI0004A6E3AB|nr:hypothetical protein [Pelobacter seleniigenes]
MIEYIAALIIFLLAFAGLAAGLLMRRKGLRGGCHSSGEACHCDTSAKDHECRCESDHAHS